MNTWVDTMNSKKVQEEAVQALTKIYNTPFTLVEVLNSYVRYRSQIGHEYILDLLVQTNSKQVEQRRVSLRRPEVSELVLVEDTSPKVLRRPINFVVPAHNVVTRLKEFLHAYEAACLKEDGNCKLHIVMYDSNEIQTVTEYLEQIKNRHPIFQYYIVKGSGVFNRGVARDFGLSSLQEDDLVSMVDVDINFDKEFLGRCRQNTIQGKRVYFPMVFKYYNMEFVHPNHPPRPRYAKTTAHGYWCRLGYGVACLYKSDYSKLGGFDLKFKGWGGEDTDIYERFLRSFEVFRAPDPGLVHQFHFSSCSGLTGDKCKNCIGSRNDGLAGKVELADYVYRIKYNMPDITSC